MTLRLTTAEAEDVREALLEAHTELIRRLAGGVGCGYSPQGVALCARKARLARILDLLEQAPTAVSLPEPVGQMVLREAA